MQCEGDKTYATNVSCAVCKMDLELVDSQTSITEASGERSDEAILNLTSKWKTEEGDNSEHKELNGKTLVMDTIYASCHEACPNLDADLRNIEDKIPKERLQDLNFVLVSIDPNIDTAERLKAFAIENAMDDEHWTFLQGTESGVREFANVLSVKY